jgi:hypothetical protein
MERGRPVREFFQRGKIQNFIRTVKNAFMAHGSVRDF